LPAFKACRHASIVKERALLSVNFILFILIALTECDQFTFHTFAHCDLSFRVDRNYRFITLSAHFPSNPRLFFFSCLPVVRRTAPTDKKRAHRLPWQSQTEDTRWNSYITQLGDTVLHSLQAGAMVASEHNAAYSRLGSELLAELHSHVTNCRRRLRSIGLSQSLEAQPSIVLHVQRLICADSGPNALSLAASSKLPAAPSRHPPIIVVGAQGSGKSTVLSQVFVHCADWLPTGM
jgi:hypothetical protein